MNLSSLREFGERWIRDPRTEVLGYLRSSLRDAVLSRATAARLPVEGDRLTSSGTTGHPFAQANAPRKRDKKDEEELEGPSFAEILLDRLQIIEKEDAAERAASAATPTPHTPRPSASPAAKPDSPSGIIDKLQACVDSSGCHSEEECGHKRPPLALAAFESRDLHLPCG